MSIELIKKVIHESGVFGIMEDYAGKIIDSIAGDRKGYSSDKEYEMTLEAIAKFKKLYKERLPEHAYNDLIPLYQETFTEEELQQIVDLYQTPLFIKLKGFAVKVSEKTEKSLETFTADTFKEAFADLMTDAMRHE
jgi:hypothetical protein